MTVNNLFLHVPNHALKRFAIEVLYNLLFEVLYFTNFAIHFFNKNNIFKSKEAEQEPIKSIWLMSSHRKLK